MEKETITAESFLGYKNVNSKLKVVLNSYIPEESYISYTFTNGSICDLTQKPREIETRFFCPSKEKMKPDMSTEEVLHHISQIVEPGSCIYQMNFYSTHLCKLNNFKKKEEKIANVINCYDVDAVGVTPNPKYRKPVKKTPSANKVVVENVKKVDTMALLKSIIGIDGNIKIQTLDDIKIEGVDIVTDLNDLDDEKVKEALRSKIKEMLASSSTVEQLSKMGSIDDKTKTVDQKRSESKAPSEKPQKDKKDEEKQSLKDVL
jgi:hypothetical protein